MRETITALEFAEIVTNVSSEMFISIMAILQEKLPCAEFYFRQRLAFREKNAQMSYSPITKVENGPQQKSVASTGYSDNG